MYKQNGAAVANVISELIVTMAYMYFSFKVIPFTIGHKPLLFNLLATIPFIAVVVFCNRLGLNAYYTLLIDAFAFIGLYFIIQLKLLKNSVVNELLAGYLIKRK
jgi:hypothetical protein